MSAIPANRIQGWFMSSIFLTYSSLLPIAVPTVGACGLALRGASGGQVTEESNAKLTLLILLTTLVGLVVTERSFVGSLPFGPGFLADPMTWFFSVFSVLGTAACVLLCYGSLKTYGIQSSSDFYAILLMTLVGAVVLLASGELITMFVGLEILSMGLYCLCVSSSTSSRGVEAGIKYFILGSFSSAFFLYGIALIYGITGSTVLTEIGDVLPHAGRAVSGIAIGLVSVGIFFKLGAVPFHFWTPDVYQGVPHPVTSFMASVVKMAVVSIAIRILWIAFGDEVVVTWWSGFAWTVAVLTMVGGNLIAVRQRNVKRMLAYSSIAHVGYMCAALLVPSNQFGGGAALLFYIVTYSSVTIGAFAITMTVTGSLVDEPRADDITLFQGLSATRPGLALLMSLFMLTLAGLPPGVAGLLGKFYIFSAVVQGNYVGLAIIGALCSAVSCFYYLRVIVAMYFQPSLEGGPVPDAVSLPVRVTLAACALASIFFGIFPSPLYARSAVILNSILPKAP